MIDAGLRDCFSAPISEIFEAARLLDKAVAAHIGGNRLLADDLIRKADIRAIGDWLDPLWLRQSALVRACRVDGLPPVLPRADRHKPRNSPANMRSALIARDGHHCRFCGMPLVRAKVRKVLNKLYPEAARWTSTKPRDQHRGLQVMWLQYDHIVVHSRGGQTTLENQVLACAACNYGRDKYSLEEMRLSDPRKKVRLPTWDGRLAWTGLETILPESARCLQSPSSPFKPV